MPLKNNVRALRKQQSLRQEDLAEALGVSRQTVIAIENGRYSPSLELALKMARYFKTSVESVFSLDEGGDF